VAKITNNCERPFPNSMKNTNVLSDHPNKHRRDQVSL
jgi:hypothetical protein